MSERKLIVASARLPVAVTCKDSDWQVNPSPGGLATALRSVAARRAFTWVGWPGVVPAGVRSAVAEHLDREFDAVPVYIDPTPARGFYEEFSNRVLWPLLHNLPTPRTFVTSAWNDYQQVNRQFSDAIAEIAEPGDTIWVHDYQLALVPHFLRRRGLDCPIGFFLHIPFPASETFRTLPVREAILRGILGANLIGFHTYEYVSHFRSAALRILGVESEIDKLVLRLPTHSARLSVLPLGVEPDEIARMAAQPEATEQLEALRREYQGKKVVLGVDRLDYTKGLPQKFLAFEELLEKHPELRRQVVLIQVAAPSRSNVTEYQNLKRELDELVGRINGRYGSLEHTPLVYVTQNVPQVRLTALYRRADVALVTPVRDGMNLVCLEYIAARGDEPGTLILSEFAGAASSLSGAVLVNPHNPSEIADALYGALSGRSPAASSFQQMRDQVRENTATQWAQKFLDQLEHTARELRVSARRLDFSQAREAIERAGSPLLLLDYDGTLTPHVRIAMDAAPTPALRSLLARLAHHASVYVVSGRTADNLEAWLGDLDLGLVCEHGLAVRPSGGEWSASPALPTTAIDEIVLPMLRAFSGHTPGSRIERKTSSVAWHYRDSDPKLGAWRARELRLLLESQLVGQPYSVLAGSKVIEVRHVDITKGTATRALLANHAGADFIFCAGNDRTDVDMFDALERSGLQPRLSCQVGTVHTGADCFVETPAELLEQLELLCEIWERRDPAHEPFGHLAGAGLLT